MLNLMKERHVRSYVGILKIASKGENEPLVSKYLEQILEREELPRLADVKKHFDNFTVTIPSVEVLSPDPRTFNQLLSTFINKEL